MLRRGLLLAAALAVAPAVAPAHATQAAPPYCVTVSDGGGMIAYNCVIGWDCAVYGEVGKAGWCVYWP